MRSFKTTGKATVLVHFNKTPASIEVYDANRQLYFFRELKGTEKKIKFNVCHPGAYFFDVDADIEVLPFTKSETLRGLSIPTFERDKMKGLKGLTLKNGNFPEMARVYTDKGVIETGQNWRRMPPAIRYFIYLHELAHFFYISEDKCDAFALYFFLDKGYNDSTALYALTKILKDTPENKRRINNLFKLIKQ